MNRIKYTPYKLGLIKKQVAARNAQEGVHPENFRVGEDRRAYLKRTKKLAWLLT